MTPKVALILLSSLSLGLLLQVLGCALWNNWWPMLTALMYVLVPMPYLFFGPGTSGGYADIGGTSEGWMDAGKFLTGCSAVASFAIPAILAHSGTITIGACWMELVASLVLLFTGCAYDYYRSMDYF